MYKLADVFQELSGKKVAVYGLGAETERLLPDLKSLFDIIGLLDGFKSEGELFGYQIISLEEAVTSGIQAIIVIARPGSCKVIAKKVSDICKNNNIVLLDIRGKDLLKENKHTYNFSTMYGYTKKTLLEKIQNYEVISFDLFDTLIMRKLLLPTDVFDILSYRLMQKGIVIESFTQKRLESEKMLSRTTIPGLTEIYRYMLKSYSIMGITAEELAEYEFDCDLSLIIPRSDIVSLAQIISANNKYVCIISDTYYTKNQTELILKKCGIDFYSDLLISCEHGTDKTRNLFDVLKTNVEGKSIIHIGDDMAADIESAERHNIDAFKIYSAIDFLEIQGFIDPYDTKLCLSERIKIGLFISRIFNSPFQFEHSNGEIQITECQDIGFLFIAPIITDFVIWLTKQCEDNGVTDVIFCARDGYLIKEIFDMISDIHSIYYYTSRISAIRAGMMTTDDVEYVNEMKYSGTLTDQLLCRFGISADNIDKDNDLIDYKEIIMQRSESIREYFHKYINNLDFKGENIAFFDFVAKGTCQLFTERMFEKKMRGYYFLRLEEYSRSTGNLDIVPFYPSEISAKSAVYEDYYILETIMSSPEPSVLEYDSLGTPVFSVETRSAEDIRCIMDIHKGIKSFFSDYIVICPKSETKISRNVDEILLRLIHNYRIINKSFNNLNVEDSFFNRMTEISDLL